METHTVTIVEMDQRCNRRSARIVGGVVGAVAVVGAIVGAIVGVATKEEKPFPKIFVNDRKGMNWIARKSTHTSSVGRLSDVLDLLDYRDNRDYHDHQMQDIHTI